MHVEQVAPYLWRIPPDAALGMRVPGVVVADEPLMRRIRLEPKSASTTEATEVPRAHAEEGVV